ncbi:sarcosine oxidase subunit gamma family protein [Thalassotalea psychrophila]|uniref:Sarcosine oxidase subunit gamma family protein n=1 Tax=Thalassotalea psychrophila TaxID=3065647 RepID=A0ABY9TYN7_9GAMM|nr:sarcosine oxidase subunit gamma family protein [Colwelliaceae bacterium SQ149]
MSSNPKLFVTSTLAELHQQVGEAKWQNANVSFEEICATGLVRLQGPGSDEAFLQAVKSLLGVALPTKACTASANETYRIMWLNPNEWLVSMPIEQELEILEKLITLQDNFISLTTLNTDSRVGFTLTGNEVVELMSKGCSLDMHSKFAVNSCTVTKFAEIPVILDHITQSKYNVYVDRGLARFLWDWLIDASVEFN